MQWKLFWKSKIGWGKNAFFFRTDPNTKQILESMRSGSINIKQAAEALGMEPAMLAYQLAGKVILDLLESVSNF